MQVSAAGLGLFGWNRDREPASTDEIRGPLGNSPSWHNRLQQIIIAFPLDPKKWRQTLYHAQVVPFSLSAAGGQGHSMERWLHVTGRGQVPDL